MSELSFHEHAERDARLCILRELAKQTDGRANESILAEVLVAFGHNRSREWLRTQLRKLEEIGAVRLHFVGDYMVPEITRAGLDHVERRVVIEGVKRPSPGA